MNAYSKDLRLKVLSAVDRGVPRKEVSDLFGVSRSTIKRWLKRRRLTGDVDTHKIPGRPSAKGKALRGWLPPHLERNPDLSLGEHCEAFEEETGVGFVAVAGFALRRSAARVRGRVGVPHLDGPPEVSGPERGAGPRHGVPRNRGKNTTPIASISLSGMGEAMCIRGATDAAVFEAYVERFLAPTLSEGQVVVLDNLGAHRPRRVRELIEARGAELVFLPPYSPDLSPIEEAFSKIKNALRKAGARTHEALLGAMAGALSAVTPADAAGWFDHCGYEVEAQYL
jgi:transposase